MKMLVKASLEVPGFPTLDWMTSRIRSEVNTAINSCERELADIYRDQE